MQVHSFQMGQQPGLRLPKELAATVGHQRGLARRRDRGSGPHRDLRRRPVYTLAELLVGMTPEAMHEAFDWGEDLGRERVE